MEGLIFIPHLVLAALLVLLFLVGAVNGFFIK